MAFNFRKELTKKLKPGAEHFLKTLATGGAATGVELVQVGRESEQFKKEEEERRAGEAATAEAEAAALARQKKTVKQRRLVLGRRGQRSTRRSGVTPDLFATSGGATKTLLG